MRTGLTKQEKTTDIWFDEKDPLIHIRTHNTDLKKRLACLQPDRYPGELPARPTQTRKRAAWSLKSAKGRFSFRLTAPYSEERRESGAAVRQKDNAAEPLKGYGNVHICMV